MTTMTKNTIVNFEHQHIRDFNWTRDTEDMSLESCEVTRQLTATLRKDAFCPLFLEVWMADPHCPHPNRIAMMEVNTKEEANCVLSFFNDAL